MLLELQCTSVKVRMYRQRQKNSQVNSRLYLSSFWKPFMYSGTGHPACWITLATLKKVPVNINLYLVKLLFIYLNPLHNRRGTKTTQTRN